MYIIYDRFQREVINTDGYTNLPSINNPYKHKKKEPISDFKPSKLVRISDMQVVRGDQVDEEYWALSYSWNQSGEIYRKWGVSGSYDRVDKGWHQIYVSEQPNSKRQKAWRTVHQFLGVDTEFNRFVKFEGILQQICEDFGIKYLWYDQMCINQDDDEEKANEIKKMHQVYENARCTVALVPELHYPDPNYTVFNKVSSTGTVDISAIIDSEWSKRMWTLEETYKSPNLLFVGTNVHIWSSNILYTPSSDFKTTRYLFNIRKKHKWCASTALSYARTRTSTKAHDRVFAFVNIFPNLKQNMDFSYNQDLLKLMLQFYGRLANVDPSILLFGIPLDTKKDEISKTRKKEACLLPSWTGTAGLHIPQVNDRFGRVPIYNIDHIISSHLMTINDCNFIPINIGEAGLIRPAIIVDDPPYAFTPDGLPRTSILPHHEIGSADENLTFVSVTKDSAEQHNCDTKVFGLKATHFLPVLLDDNHARNTLSMPTHVGGFLSLTKECTQCYVICDICFPLDNKGTAYPVVANEGATHYKSIGLCIIKSNHLVVKQSKRTFTII